MKKRIAFFLALLMSFMSCVPVNAGTPVTVQSESEEPEVPILRGASDYNNESNTASGNGNGFVWWVSNKTLYIADETKDCEITTPTNGKTVEVFQPGFGKIAEVVETIQFYNSDLIDYNVITEGFKGYTALKSIAFSSDVVSIGAGVFIGCNKLETISVAGGTKYRSDGKVLYSSDNKLIAVAKAAEIPLEIEAGTTYIEKYAAMDCKLKGSLVIPDTVLAIGESAFSNCANLGTLEIKGTPNIGNSAFKDCKGLTSVTATTTTIGKEAFSGCINLSSLTLNDGVTTIDEKAFFDCKKLASAKSGSLSIPKTVTTIGTSAFEGCSSVEMLTFWKNGENRYSAPVPSVRTIGDRAFANTGIVTAFIPAINDTVGFSSTTLADNNNLKYVFYYGTEDVAELKSEKELIKLYEKINGGYTGPGGSTRYGFEFPNGSTASVIMLPYNHAIVYFDPREGKWRGSDSVTVSHIEIGQKFDASQLEDAVPPDSTTVKKEFDGWRYLSYPDMVFDHDSVINNDQNVFAKYVASYPIVFMYDGNTTDPVYVKAGHSLTDDQIPDPTVAGLVFKYWTSTKYRGHYSREDLKKMEITHPDTFNAEYSGVCQVIFYDSDEYIGDDDHVLLRKTVSQGGIIADLDDIVDDPAVSAKLSRLYPDSNYDFTGWYNGTTKWTNRKKIPDNTDSFDLWARYSHTIVLKLDYGKDYADYYGMDDPVKEFKVDCGVGYGSSGSFKLPVMDELPNYRFTGWYNVKDGEIVRPNSEGLNYFDEDTELYAKWLPVHTVKFYDTANIAPEFYASVDVISGDAIGIMLPEGPDDRGEGEDSYAFDNWNTRVDGKGMTIARDTVINEPLNAYTIWVHGHTVKFFDDDYEHPVDRAVIKHNETVGYFPEVEKLGYIFVGWNTEPDGSGDFLFTDTLITDAVDVYAIWYDDPSTPNDPQVTVSFNSMGGSEIDSVTLSVNTVLSKPEDPVYHDHKLLGWYKDEACTSAWDFAKDTVSCDMYLYAGWKYWTDEDEAEYQDNLKGIYWVKVVRGENISVADYFKESGLKYSYDKKIISLKKKSKSIKGKKIGTTLVTARRVDGSDYKTAIRVFVLKQTLLDMYAYNTGTILDAKDYLTVSGFLPDRWLSTKPSVARIDPKTGVITVLSRGKAVIKAQYKNSTVRAYFNSEVPKFTKPFIRMKTGQTKKLKIRRLRNYDIVSWNVVSADGTSRNKPLSHGDAEIDYDGRITALTAGDVTVYATIYGETISCKVHIEPPILRTKSIVLDINKTKKIKLSRTKLKYVEWQSSNDQIAYVDPVSGRIYALQAGRVILKTEAGGVTNTCSVQVQDPYKNNGSKK